MAELYNLFETAALGMQINLELYFARCGRKRAYVVAPSAERAYYVAGQVIGVPSRNVTLQRVDDELILDTEAMIFALSQPDGPDGRGR